MIKLVEYSACVIDGALFVEPGDEQTGPLFRLTAKGLKAPSDFDEPVLVSNEATQGLRAPAFRAFFRLADEWQLTENEQIILLGSPTASDFQSWSRGDLATGDGDVLERISLLLGIYQATHTLLPDVASANRCMRAANAAPIFPGMGALDFALGGGIAELRQIRAYLDAQLRKTTLRRAKIAPRAQTPLLK